MRSSTEAVEKSSEAYGSADAAGVAPSDFVWDEKESVFDRVIDFCDNNEKVVTILELLVLAGVILLVIKFVV